MKPEFNIDISKKSISSLEALPIQASDLEKEAELRQEVIDYLELALYATAEHVDAVALIAKGFSPAHKKCKPSEPARQLEKSVKKHKTLISATINAIKHNQVRIRLYSTEIVHGEKPHCLHGYFIEGVNDGVVGPSKVFQEIPVVLWGMELPNHLLQQDPRM